MSQPAIIKLNDGNTLPIFGFGTATALLKGKDGKGDCSDTLLGAVQKGFRHIDTASTYLENEAAVGKMLKEWETQGGKRSDLTITTKWGYSDDPERANHDSDALLALSLERMGVDHIDLYLMHEPFPRPLSLAEAWKKMEGYKIDRRVRSIGVSNFASKHIEELAKTWISPPVVNEIEYHPYCFSDPQITETLETCRKYNIAVGAYTTLASLTREEFRGGPVDAVVDSISAEKNITKAQVLLAWARHHIDGPIITTGMNQERYQQTLESIHIILSEEEIKAIDHAGRRGGIKRRYAPNVWGDIGHVKAPKQTCDSASSLGKMESKW